VLHVEVGKAALGAQIVTAPGSAWPLHSPAR
jgi:hypothetical protein